MHPSTAFFPIWTIVTILGYIKCCDSTILKKQKKLLNSQGTYYNILMRHLMLFAVEKDLISGLNEEVDWRISSNKCSFDCCECKIFLALIILENNYSQQYVVGNMLTTFWVWRIKLRNHLDGNPWLSLISRIWQVRNLNFKSSEQWRSRNSICPCNDSTSQSTSKGKEKI